jgi:hypothetical protein
MTKEQLFFYVETQKVFEFTYKGKVYNMTYDRDEKGNTVLVFGRLYEGKRYAGVGELLNTAKIENHFFKDMLDTIDIR